jgi:hypothetical protein
MSQLDRATVSYPVPQPPVATSLQDILHKDTNYTYSKTTDSLEAIADTVGTAAELAKVPKSDAAVTWNATALASIKSYGNIVSLASATTAGVIVEDGNTGTANVVTITSKDDTANTFGSWTQIDASASANSWLASITISFFNWGASGVCVLEIGTGVALSEATKVRCSFYFTYMSGVGCMIPVGITFPIPIKIASGTRIAARLATGDANKSINLGHQLYQSLET